MGKKRKNAIFSLQHNGNPIETDEEILEHATQYYKGLFGPSDNPSTHLDPNYWDPEDMVEPHENEQLTKKFTEEEVKHVIMTMEKKYSPRA